MKRDGYYEGGLVGVNMGWDRIVMVGEKNWIAQKNGGGLRQEMTRWRDGRSGMCYIVMLDGR